MKKTVDVVIPVYRPTETLGKILEKLAAQTYPVRKVILMVTENPEAVYPLPPKGLPIERHDLKPEAYDHGGTRNEAVSYSEADFVLFLTEDAEPEKEDLIETLVSGFSTGNVIASYGRQLPKPDTRIIEQYTRRFNYPEASGLKRAEDEKTLGIKTYFCSDVCCMYDREKFIAMGGFDAPVIFNEDMLFAYRALQAGYGIYYNGKATVIHAHNYSGKVQFMRNFDLAVSQAQHPEIFSRVSSESEGKRLVLETAGYLWKNGKGYMIPYLIYQSGMKFLGYRAGKKYKKRSAAANRRMSQNKMYWEDRHGTDQSNTL